MMTLTAEKGMLTREISRVERIVATMKKNDKLGDLERTLRGLRTRYQEIEKEQALEQKKNTDNKS